MRIRPASVQLNHAHPLAESLVWATVGGAPYTHDLIGGGQATSLNAGVTFDGVSEIGSAIASTATGDSGVQWPFAERALSITTAHSIFVWARSVTLGTYAKLFSVPYRVSSWAAPYVSISLQRLGSNSTLEAEIAIGGTLYSAVSDSGLIANGDGLTLYGVTREGATVRFYRNGVQYGAAKSVNAGTVDWGEKASFLWGRHHPLESSTWFGMVGEVNQILLFDRALTAEQALALHNDPWAIFETASVTLSSTSALLPVAVVTGTSAIHVPTLTAVYPLSVDVVVTVSKIDAPSIRAASTLVLESIVSEATAYAVSASAHVSLVMDAVAASALTQGVTLISENILAPDNVPSSGAVYPVGISAVVTVALGTLDGGSVVYAPSITSLMLMPLDAIGAMSVAHPVGVLAENQVLLDSVLGLSASHAVMIAYTVYAAESRAPVEENPFPELDLRRPMIRRRRR